MDQEDVFLPGSEWLYYKFYTGEGYSNRFIEHHLYPIILECLKEKTIFQWFFIRYNDPKSHLRVRLKISDRKNLGNVIQQIESKSKLLVKQGLISKIELATYKREWFRYGKKNIELVEKLWFYESECLVKAISQLGDTMEYVILILATIHILLEEYYENIQDIFAHTEHHFLAFCSEFNIRKDERKILSNKFREFISKEDLRIESFSEIYSKYAFALQYRKKIKPIIQQLDKDNSILCSSLIHMLVNRAFNKSQRQMELVAYHHLFNLYKSDLARINK